MNHAYIFLAYNNVSCNWKQLQEPMRRDFAVVSTILSATTSVADPDPFDTDTDPAFHFDTDPDPAFQFDTLVVWYGSGSSQFQSGNVPKTVRYFLYILTWFFPRQ